MDKNSKAKNNNSNSTEEEIKILQWNIRGIQSNFLELQVLVAEQQPQIICLQETKLNANKQKDIKQYVNYSKAAEPSQTNSAGGITTYINNTITQSEIKINQNLNIIVTKITTNKTITICNMYLPPNTLTRTEEILKILNDLPKPLILIGDFNGHSHLWGNKRTNLQGKCIEEIITQGDIHPINKAYWPHTFS
ncbi:hypothetical protein HELRODRAFT_175932 [Helobdella robusta]|uniref:Endonuclease/exonuclease/phosphatase domain-containing protein n=1 Tax=Helobdella robusta TaxID=6412 RepID=T1F9X3_HELRO|nr:hypothetical protein HELRODRAFT_175932 [Helobdella robusta]ESO00495.1 hypothetical protein HELRODRAFT_175932 [Helobdella robusta]